MIHTAYFFVSGKLHVSDLSSFLTSLHDFSKKHSVKIQGFDARKIVDDDHLLFSIYRAEDAFSKGINEAKDIGLEVLRFSSGQRKIDKAFSMGLYEGENDSIFIFFGESDKQLKKIQKEFCSVFGLKESISLSLHEKKPFLMAQFNITESELDAVGENCLKDLVMERIALTGVTR
ncbi:MAG: KEOPS complex subunit Cgi121 [Methanimicrococcus sp.]|nr:KEOPS complex subunit Cgi121 [Methanimicrococcus sp.]